MASLYNLEPQPTAKVVLQTTSGDLQLELFGKQTPLATRNFLQHCLDGYYTNTIFHRLVPGFIIQGGDPTGTGSGGISAVNDGEPFQDEIHSRLKFNRRGLLGMANEGKDSNGSQFFLTLGVTAELQGKHTMFGRIEGDTIYNLMKMGDAEMTDDGERPLYPTRITGAEILVNPFPDMVARVKEAPRTSTVEAGKKEVKKRKKPAGKNVLSFGGEEGEDEVAPVVKKAKANPKLVSVGEAAPEELNNAPIPKAPTEKKAKTERRRKSPTPEVAIPVRAAAAPPTHAPARQEQDEDDEEEQDDPRATKSKAALDKTNAEIAALKASMKRTVDIAPKEKEKPKSMLEAMIPSTSTRARKRGKPTDESGALDLFNAFKRRLEDLPTPAAAAAAASSSTANGHTDNADKANGTSHNPDPTTAEAAADDEEAALCDLHFIANCQSCKSWDTEKPDGDADEDGDDDPGWMAHQLTFAKDTLGKDLKWKQQMAEIEVIDPREKAREIAGERRGRGREKEKGKGRS